MGNRNTTKMLIAVIVCQLAALCLLASIWVIMEKRGPVFFDELRKDPKDTVAQEELQNTTAQNLDKWKPTVNIEDTVPEEPHATASRPATSESTDGVIQTTDTTKPSDNTVWEEGDNTPDDEF